MLVAIEGIDASGKATQARLLCDWLERCVTERRVDLFSFPDYSTATGNLLQCHLQGLWAAGLTPEGTREAYLGNKVLFSRAFIDAMTFQCLMIANRVEAAPRIRKAQKDGYVICDRWRYSSVAYGGVSGIPMDLLIDMQADLPDPDINILLDIDAMDSVQRRPERRDRHEKQAGLMEAVSKNYLELWAKHHSTDPASWVVIDARGKIEETHSLIVGAIQRHPTWRRPQ